MLDATVVIPAIQVETLVERCVRECARTCGDADIVVVLDHDEGVERLQGKATSLVSGPVTIAAKRNLAARVSAAEFVAFIDSDAYPETGWLENAIGLLRANESLGAVGGPNVSPHEQTNSERVVGFALRSVLVTGLGNFRKTIQPARLVTDLPSCNLIVRRTEYLNMGGMNESLFTGEDMDFCRRLVARGRQILYSPDVLVYHKNRDLKSFVKQRLTFGSSVFRLLNESLELDFFVLLLPAAFILFLFSAPLALVWPLWAWVYSTIIAIYAIAVVTEAFRQSESLRFFPGTLLAIVIGNLLPGVGTIANFLNLLPDLRKIYRNDH